MSGVDYEKYAFSFSHGIIKLADRQFTALKGIEFKQDIDREAVYGTSRKPLKRAAGQLKMGEGTLSFSDLEEAMQFYDTLGDDPSIALFALDCTVANEAGQVRSFECLSCALSGFTANFQQGAGALELDMPFSFMLLKVNGKEFAR